MDFFYARAALFAAVFLPASISDIKTLTVPRIPLLALCAALVALSAFPGSRTDLGEAIAGTFEALIVMYGTRVITRKKLGLGDVWAGMCVGALGGIGVFACSIGIAIGSSCIVATILRRRKGERIPFVPHLGAATFFSVFLFDFLGN
jgi:prepilin signal peptidase PulO-like enzyme (type II secretory pathway)